MCKALRTYRGQRPAVGAPWRPFGEEIGGAVEAKGGGCGRMQPLNEPLPHAKQAGTAISREQQVQQLNTLYNVLYLLIVPIDCIINHHGKGSRCKCFMSCFCIEMRAKPSKELQTFFFQFAEHTTGVSCCPEGSHDVIHLFFFFGASIKRKSVDVLF